MTVGLAYSVPGEGAVLAVDGRVTDANAAIITDNEKKWAICGHSGILVAGIIGNFWMQIQRKTPTTYHMFRKKLSKHAEHHSDLMDEFEWLSYDRKTEQLALCDTLISAPYIGVGAGSPWGIGALEAQPRAKTLDTAYKALQSAIEIACRRNSSCGGEITMVVMPVNGSIVKYKL